MSRENFWALLWGSDAHFHELHFVWEAERVQHWIPCHHKGRFTRLLDTTDCYVSAVPRRRKYDDLSWDDVHMLWAYLPTPESCRRLERFTPTPSMVWRDGRSSRRWAAWGLSQPLRARWCQQATERLAHHLGGRRRDAAPHTMIASPFSGKWFVEHELAEFYSPRQIVGGLRDAPDPHQWKAAA